jgi:chromosome segregation ATPase
MIATKVVGAARFLLLSMLLVGCQTEPRVNSAWQAKADARIHDLEGERAHYARECYRLEQAIREDEAATEAVRQRAGAQAERLRAAMGDLEHQLALLQAAEQDLAQARARTAGVAAELTPLRAQEAEVAGMQKRLSEVQAQGAALQEQVRVAEADLAGAQVRLGAKLQEVQKRREAVGRVDAAAEAALRAVGEAIGPLLPPAPPPATPPAPAGTPPPATGQPK